MRHQMAVRTRVPCRQPIRSRPRRPCIFHRTPTTSCLRVTFAVTWIIILTTTTMILTSHSCTDIIIRIKIDHHQCRRIVPCQRQFLRMAIRMSQLLPTQHHRTSRKSRQRMHRSLIFPMVWLYRIMTR